MRIAFAIGAHEIGGAERYLQALIEAVTGPNDSSVVVGRMPMAIDRAGQEFVDLGPKWSRRTIPAAVAHFKRERSELLSALARTAPDLIHMQFKREQIALTARASTIAPVVWTEHGTWPPGGYGKVLATAYRRAARHVKRIVCVSQPVADSLLTHVGVPAHKLLVIDNPVDLARFRPPTSGSESELIRQSLGVPADATMLVTTSRLEHSKGLDVALAALAHLPEAYRLAIVGDGSYARELEQQARAMGITDRTVFAGFRNDIDAVLRASDVFLLPSRSAAREGSPLSLLQAIATAVPAVISEEAGVSSIAPEAGVLTVDLRPEAWAVAIRQAVTSRTTLAERSRLAAERFSQELWASRHSELFSSVVAGRSGN